MAYRFRLKTSRRGGYFRFVVPSWCHGSCWGTSSEKAHVRILAQETSTGRLMNSYVAGAGIIARRDPVESTVRHARPCFRDLHRWQFDCAIHEKSLTSHGAVRSMRPTLSQPARRDATSRP